MSNIRSTDSKPEVYIRKLLFSKGWRYRKNYRNIPGTPDIYFPGRKTAVFIHGCYWHRHSGCPNATTPKTNCDFWDKKFNDNIKRDRLNMEKLREQKKRVLIIWECTIRKMRKNQEEENVKIKIIEDFLNGDMEYLEL